MRTLRNIAVMVLLITAIATTVWALADSKSVNILFEAAWERSRG